MLRGHGAQMLTGVGSKWRESARGPDQKVFRKERQETSPTAVGETCLVRCSAGECTTKP